MAKKKPQSKTAAIREALKTTESPSEVAAMLKKQGLKVSAQYVSTIKAADKKKAAAGGVKRGPGRPAKAPTNGHAAATDDLKTTNELLMSAIDLVIRSGGEKEAIQLIRSGASILAKVR